MKAFGFDGRERVWNLSGKKPKKNSKRNCSKLHVRTRTILQELFPTYRILEAVKLPGSQTSTRKSVLYVDFFIQEKKLVVEVNGRQHYEFVPFYHKTKRDFYKSKVRDKDKQEWCDINGLDMVSLKYTGTDDEWRETINSR